MARSIRKTFIAMVSVFAVLSFNGSAAQNSEMNSVVPFEINALVSIDKKMCPTFPDCF